LRIQELDSKEVSIHNAYIDIIENSEYFIYIENQFFVSSLASSIVKNRVALALLNRIKRAIVQNQIFRVVIIVPVHPDGTWKDSEAVRYVMRWQYHTISRGGNSLLELLAKEYPKFRFIRIYNI